MSAKNHNFNQLMAYLCLMTIVAILFIVLATPTYLQRGKALEQTDRAATVERLKGRRRHLGEKCLELDLNIPDKAFNYTAPMSHFMVNRDYDLIWCPVFKAASTSWIHYLNILAGYSSDYLQQTGKNIWGLLRQRYPKTTLDELQEAQNTSITFLVVRHPFERLVSGYCNKLAVPNEYYHNRFGKTIIANYRRRGEVPPHPEFPTFPEFVRWLCDLAVRGAHINEHFETVTTYCTPCLVEIDLILKFETLAEDQKYLLDLAGIADLVETQWMNQGPCAHNSTEFFAQLTLGEMRILHEYYRFDFELFNYSAQPYFDAVKRQ